MFQELDTIVLTHDIPEYGLKRGDIGAVVHCYKDGAAFEVEFVTVDGRTIALLTLPSSPKRIKVRGDCLPNYLTLMLSLSSFHYSLCKG